jgi:hypothetical protein
MRQFNLRFGLAGAGVLLGSPPSQARSHTGLTERGRLNAYDRDILGCARIVACCVPEAKQAAWFCRYGERRGATDGPRRSRLWKILAETLYRPACVIISLPELARPRHGSASTRPQR